MPVCSNIKSKKLLFNKYRCHFHTSAFFCSQTASVVNLVREYVSNKRRVKGRTDGRRRRKNDSRTIEGDSAIDGFPPEQG